MAVEEEAIARGPVGEWLEERVPSAEQPFDFQAIHGGLSNLTFLVTDGTGRRWVFRRPPLGKALGNAHDMGREVKVVSALNETPVPVPPVVGYCDDEEVNGAPFYVMKFVDGIVLRGPDEAAAYPRAETRARIGHGLIDTLVAIHEVDPDGAGLGDLGRRDGYVERQLTRWSGQWEKSKTRSLPVVEEVHRRLANSIPEQIETAIVHGDYRLDNVIYDADGTVAAVVDWELCTLGDPRADLGLLMVYWTEPEDEGIALFRPATSEPGFPRRGELLDRYRERSGRDLAEIEFFVALGYWKLAIIAEGVLSRFRGGQYGEESREAVEAFQAAVEKLAEEALENTERLG
jgi:aminoglycoside phosphotransferase (APT) family kinase protein